MAKVTAEILIEFTCDGPVDKSVFDNLKESLEQVLDNNVLDAADNHGFDSEHNITGWVEDNYSDSED